MSRKMLIAALFAALASGAAAASDAGAKTAAPGAIPPGYRGFALPLPGTELAFVKKGDRVDVLAEFEASTKGKGDDVKDKVVATILQNVLVADLKRPEKLDEIGVIELTLNPNEAQYAALSLAQGSVHLALRGTGDVEMHPMEMASFRKLFQ